MNYIDKVFYKDASDMSEIPSASIDLVITSPPYFNIKDYSLDGKQTKAHSGKARAQLGDLGDYKVFIKSLLTIWKECERVLAPNGKLIINSPLMPMEKNKYSTHHNRHIFDINADIQNSILYRRNTRLFLYDVYIWNRSNTAKSLMFGSYPYPRNFYAQNTSEFITVYVKDGLPRNNLPDRIKKASKLTQKEWVELTKQIWTIPIPNRNDIAFGKHSAIMPEEIVRRCIKLFTFVDDTVLDPFAGSGTTLKVACEMGRRFVGYEIVKSYREIINKKIELARKKKCNE
ncbi:MAG: site-specific DNA-methyltransferase [Candidatus Saccharibacteria bacterium]|nr:site-specific DNA-methyltransferase [Candidatus Saccharibacteria bacterium]